MISLASASVMGAPLTCCIRFTVAVQPPRSLVFPRGRPRSWHTGHFASNRTFPAPPWPPTAGAVIPPLWWSPRWPSTASSAPRPRRANCREVSSGPDAVTPPASSSATTAIQATFIPIISGSFPERLLLAVLRCEELHDLGPFRVGDPIRLLPLHLLDDLDPLILRFLAGGRPVEPVADAAFLLEQGFAFRRRGHRGRRGRGLGRLGLGAPRRDRQQEQEEYRR